MVAAVVYSEIPDNHNAIEELMAVRESLLAAIPRVSKVRGTHHCAPTSYGNHAGLSLFETFHKMEGRMERVQEDVRRLEKVAEQSEKAAERSEKAAKQSENSAKRSEKENDTLRETITVLENRITVLEVLRPVAVDIRLRFFSVNLM